MTTFRVTPDGLAVQLRKLAKTSPKVLRKGLVRAARRGQAHMPGQTPTDMGQLRNGWRVLEGADGIRLENSAPHAGVVELGARPHKVNAAGRKAIAEWAMRKLGLDEAQAKSFAFALAAKIAKEGQAPTYFVRQELQKLAEFVGPAILAELKKEAAEVKP
jgi:hypothetical protein